jgi:acyl-CoA synthetase (AMP-forming)/AMP-acid ligase II
MLRTIRAHLDHRAATQPDGVYLVAPETGATLTYGELQRFACALTAQLLGLGLRSGDKVSLMMCNGYQSAALLIGIMYGGFTVAPINLLAQASQLQYVIDHSDTRVVFARPEECGRLREAIAAIGRDIRVIEVDIDSPARPRAEPLSAAELPPVSPGDDALLMYTSGTTGVPKGVLLSHQNVVAGGEYTMAAHALTEQDRVLCALPLYHINGQIVTAVTPLVSGGSVVIPHKFSATNYWQLATSHGCTWLNLVPTIACYLLNGGDPRDQGMDLSRIRFARSASAPLPPDVHRAFEEKFGIGIIETMGMTETAAPCFTNPLDRSARKIGSPGRAFGNEARVVDLEGRDVPDGSPGEICLRGDNVLAGYYKNPEATEKSFYPGGWLRSGDLGYRDTDGFYFITGRLKELIIKGGENIAPREIDEALMKHPSVLEAAAVGIPDPHYGQEIMACVVLKPGCVCAEEELRAFAVAELGKYKTPKFLRFVEDLPRGPSGKVQRLKLIEFAR